MVNTGKVKIPAVLAACFMAIVAFPGSVCAGDWPHWRGPNHDGSSEETNLPEKWTATENVLWAADMPGPASSTPVVWGDRVFVSSGNEDLTNLFALCLNRDTGKELWRKLLVDDAQTNARNDMTSCSPVTDGERVYFLFGNSELFAFDFDGTELWRKNMKELSKSFDPDWGYASSPLVYKGKLYIQSLNRIRRANIETDERSFLFCLDPATGEILWKVHRRSDAVGESLDSYTTPVPYEAGEAPAIVLAGADYITGHDAATGKELWRHASNPKKITNWRLIPSAVVADNLVCGVRARGGDAFAFRPAPNANLALEDAVWIYEERTTDVPTPLYYREKLYILNGSRRTLICLDPKTGKEIWKGEIDDSSRFWASPAAGDGKIYCIDEDGQVVVFAAGDEFKILFRTQMGGGKCKSSIAIADSKLFIRTSEKLFCISARGAAD